MRFDNLGNELFRRFRTLGFVRVEFFFAGLESLGFSLETGLGISSVASETRFRTIGDSPLRAGAGAAR